MSHPRKTTRTAALEIQPHVVRLVLLESAPGGTGLRVHTADEAWGDPTKRQLAPEDCQPLADALRQLGSKFKLAGIPLTVSLSGDFCVTRVVRGAMDEVRRELMDLEQRSALYLSLGHGGKEAAQCLVPVDARHQQALLTVANRRVLDVVCEALQRANLQPRAIEPALVSLCRIAGMLRHDAESPVLIVHGDQHGVEVGISAAGQLLLDYRPASRHAKLQVGEIIGSHLQRLQRYCDRYVRVTGGKLKLALISGDAPFVRHVSESLQANTQLQVLPLAPSTGDGQWQCDHFGALGEFSAPLGAALAASPWCEHGVGPNLLERAQRRNRAPLWPALARTFWPAAAVLMVAAVGVGAVEWEASRLRGLETQLAELEPKQSAARLARQQMTFDQQEIKHLQRIRAGVRARAWHDLTARISQCLPEDVWLDDFRVDGQGRLQLVGASFTEDGVFEFVRHLEACPELSRVALSGTRPTRLDMGPATQFDVRCDFADASTAKEFNDDNG